ncbi:uncharacterized protein SCHCODRAFT_02689408 [Schizophyllum commune H4-8]|uniref:F-box domain-containing protein n=1 Tax=Schizophyllum commune (strain H4-8 / FGSC 9210) TaxID=578458 RepID=D8Q882_SCHCM|nr:uncharacterized protein SCHCODRAFT_02689408 [Schizophyllum commune H4-8]KAI5891169.1 hypothetical protein SCHCODRAFT_02689408 [Schizophyllum commune H4-8]
MPSLLDIPAELCEEILSHLIKASHLASAALVSKTFHEYSIPLLYEQVYIYHWHGNSKARVVLLFITLSRNAHLASYVRKLVLTGPPKIIAADSEDLFTRGLRNCKALRSCTWTRDGALTSGILEALQYCPALTSLEINGRSEYNYRVELLLGFRRLEEVTIIMPDAGVVGCMAAWLGYVGGTLRRLTLICKASPLITDDTLKTWAPHLANLEHFSLVGCPKVTHEGIWSVISSNKHGIRSLGLEGLALRFSLDSLTALCTRTPVLARLTSITLTIGPHMPVKKFSDEALALLTPCPLERVHTYSTGKVIGLNDSRFSIEEGDEEATMDALSTQLSSLIVSGTHQSAAITSQPSAPNANPTISTTTSTQNALSSTADAFPHSNPTDSFCLRLVALHSHRLTRFAVYKMVLSLQAIDAICAGCPKLEQLFVVVERGEMTTIASSLAKAPRLRSVHINFPQDAHSPPLDANIIEALVVPRCGSSLRQFGCNTKVWQIERTVERKADGTDEIRTHLGPYERLEVPEQFLVVVSQNGGVYESISERAGLHLHLFLVYSSRLFATRGSSARYCLSRRCSSCRLSRPSRLRPEISRAVLSCFPCPMFALLPLGCCMLDLELEEGLARSVLLLLAAPLDFAFCLGATLALVFVLKGFLGLAVMLGLLLIAAACARLAGSRMMTTEAHSKGVRCASADLRDRATKALEMSVDSRGNSIMVGVHTSPLCASLADSASLVVKDSCSHLRPLTSAAATVWAKVVARVHRVVGEYSCVTETTGSAPSEVPLTDEGGERAPHARAQRERQQLQPRQGILREEGSARQFELVCFMIGEGGSP